MDDFDSGVGFIELVDDEVLAFDLYFATVAGMYLHPGNRNEHRDVVDFARQADLMILERRRRLCR